MFDDGLALCTWGSLDVSLVVEFGAMCSSLRSFLVPDGGHAGIPHQSIAETKALHDALPLTAKYCSIPFGSRFDSLARREIIAFQYSMHRYIA
jgi:hypothetical protein